MSARARRETAATSRCLLHSAVVVAADILVTVVPASAQEAEIGVVTIHHNHDAKYR